MKMIKFTLLFLLTLLISSCGVRKGISSSFAKEFCSCLYVESKEENYCREYASFLVPVSSYNIDQQERRIEASFIFQTSKAVFTGQKFGCKLL